MISLYLVFFIFISVYVFIWLVFILIWLFHRNNQSVLGSDLPQVSIIIPFRNESDNLPSCVQSILDQDYPVDLLELILVDDHSEDGAAKNILPHQKIKHFQVPAGAFGKKRAIEIGVRESLSDLIIIRDADTITNSNEWLRQTVLFYLSKKAKMLISPIFLKSRKWSVLGALQQMEHLALTLFSGSMALIGKPILGHGACLCFSKNAFLESGGYSKNNEIASGDDVFLIQSFRKRFPGKVHYFKNNTFLVGTEAEKSIRGMISQRLRWAGKTSRLKNYWLNSFGLLIVLSNLIFLCCLVLSFVCWKKTSVFFYIANIKLIIDFLLLFLAALFFRKIYILLWYPILCILYPLMAVSIGLASFVVQPKWKGRKIKS